MHAILGRTLEVEDDRSANDGPVAVISASYWNRRFGGDPAVLGRTVVVNRTPFTIVGVAPPEFSGIEPGRRSLAFRLRLQAADRNLTDADVADVRRKVTAAAAKFGAVLRG